MSENIENKFENIDFCYKELIDSMKKAKKSANKSGQGLLDILANFVKLYFDYYKRVVESGVNIGEETYKNFETSTKHDFALLKENDNLDKESLEDIEEKINKFYEVAKLPVKAKSKGLGEK